jgi:hypothetical protein
VIILVIIYSELETSVGVLVIGLKGAMNIGRLESVFLARFVIYQLALSQAFAESMLVDIM